MSAWGWFPAEWFGLPDNVKPICACCHDALTAPGQLVCDECLEDDE